MSRRANILAEATAIASELSGYAETEILPAAPFLAIGFDSLFLTQFAAAIQRSFNVKTTFRQLIEQTTTMEALAERLDAEAPADLFVEAPSAADTETAAPPRSASAPIPSSIAASDAKVDVDGAPDDEHAGQALSRSIPSDGLAALFARQLELMEEQLRTLQGLNADSPSRVVNQTSLAPPRAVERVTETPLAKEPSMAGRAPGAATPAPTGDLTDSQREHIKRLSDRYVAKTLGSRERVQTHRDIFADPRTAAGFTHLWKDMVYPVVVERSEGAYLWDVDGNRYIDLLNGFGPNFFGHRAPFVVEALRRQLDDGFEVGPQSPIAGEAAALFCELTGMDRVTWVNTGSEAVQAAMRVARTVTGRDKAVCFAGSYHGNFDEVLVGRAPTAPGRSTLPNAPGVPHASTSNMIVLEYGSDSALEEIQRRADEIAIVMVEPVQSRRPDFRPKAFLQALRKLTAENSIVLHFDEVITGFRIGPGGAQAYYEVRADIATYGKVLAGGMPIGAVAGSKQFMDTFDGGAWRYGDASAPTAGVTFFAGTFVRHPLAIAAARACLAYMKTVGPALQDGVNRRVDRYAAGMAELFSLYGARFELPHFASQMFLRTSGEGQIGDLFHYHLRERGVHILENYPSYLTAAHADEDIDDVLTAAESALVEMRRDGMFAVEAKGGSGAVRAGAVRRFPLTAGQREIFVASALGKESSCAYNESISLRIDGELDEQRFCAAAAASINDQEAFRLRFDTRGEFQSVDANAAIAVDFEDLSALDSADADVALDGFFAREAETPFDLHRGPLVRARLFRLDAMRRIFVVYAHHIVFDGYSTDLLLRDIKSRYEEGAGLATLKPFSVYANWSSRPAPHSDHLNAWADEFGGVAPVPLQLPRDGDPTGSRRGGGTILAAYDDATAEAAAEAGRRIGVGATAIYLAGFAALLARLSGSEQVVIGVPSAGQATSGVETIGFCVSMWPIRLEVEAGLSFADLARRAQASLNAASERPEVTMGELASVLKAPFDSSRPPIVQAALNVTRFFNDLTFGEAICTPFENARKSAQYDIFVGIRRDHDRVEVDCDYADGRYRRETVEAWIDAFMGVVRAAAVASDEEAVGLAGQAGANGPASKPSTDPETKPGSRAGAALVAAPLAPSSAAPARTAEPAEEGLSEVEAAVIEIVSAAIGHEARLGDNFFEIGGQSLRAVRIVAALRDRLGVGVELAWLFEAPNFRGFAARIAEGDSVVERNMEMEAFEF
ncbi:MAG: aminotransferase class III-fold pyridoxal phosphate-dependent enzyme [Alphaproteobacteria bacterium]|nr:aminotransferase class III-fold pyridoxal phosphate-dependent enzyme [Alphaproteobacteria bacterium]